MTDRANAGTLTEARPMKIAAADFTWPLLPHERALELIRMLDIEGLDLGLMGGRSHVRPETVRQDIPMWAGILRERVVRAGLEMADLFVIPWTDFHRMAPNHPDSKEADEARAIFLDMLELAVRLATPGMTMLPGARFDDEPWDVAIRRSAEALKWRVDEARRRGVRFSIEGHLGSCVDTPEKLMRLVELTPGLELTLDYTHFISAGFSDADVEPLVAHARHFHCRGGARDRLQTNFADNQIDYRRVIEKMRETGYDGFFAIEYVWMIWNDCNRSDTVTETILFRDLARAISAGREHVPWVSPV